MRPEKLPSDEIERQLEEEEQAQARRAQKGRDPRRKRPGNRKTKPSPAKKVIPL